VPLHRLLLRSDPGGDRAASTPTPMKGVVPMKNNFEKKLAEASVAYTYHIGDDI